MPFDWETTGESVVIGRSSRVELSVSDPAMSREHARLSLRDGTWYVEDLGSSNGTRVNGLPIGEVRPLQLGDRIEAGGTEVRLLAGDDAEIWEPPDTTTSGTMFRSAIDLAAAEPARPASDDVDRLRALTDRLGIINAVHRALTEPISLEDLLELILDRVFAHLNPEQGAVFLTDDDGNLACAASRSIDEEDAEALCSRHVVNEVIEKGQVALVNDALLDERFRASESLIGAGVRSLLAAPLLGREAPLGMIVLCSKAARRAFDEDDMELLASLASIAAMRVRNLRLTHAAAEQRRLKREVALARRIQLALLPMRLPEVPGYTLYAGNEPSAGVSGDFYQALPRSGGEEIVLMIADVSGKGIGASLLTGAMEALAAAPIESGSPPHEVYTTVSQLLLARTPSESHATSILAVLQAQSGRLQYTNAGHLPGLILRTGGSVEHLYSNGPPLGLLPNTTYEPAETYVRPGEMLVLFTDGITEAEDATGQEFGQQRFEAVCLTHRSATPAELADALETEVRSFTDSTAPVDDRTLLILKRHA